MTLEELVQEFISEDDLKNFEGWLRSQTIDPATVTDEQLAMLRRLFEEAKQATAANPKVGLMKLRSVPGEFKYAVAVREGADLWLVLWVRRSPKGEVFVMKPMNDRDSDIHTSYHLDGTLHMKSNGHKSAMQKRQPLNSAFRGAEDLYGDLGFSPKGVGAVCDPNVFSGVVELPSGVLGPRQGAIVIALVEPGIEPPDHTWHAEIVKQETFLQVTPNIVITVMREKSSRS